MKIPKEIQNILLPGEIIDKHFYLYDSEVFLSKTRFFFWRDNGYMDIPLSEIDSFTIRIEKKRAVLALRVHLFYGEDKFPGNKDDLNQIITLIQERKKSVS